MLGNSLLKKELEEIRTELQSLRQELLLLKEAIELVLEKNNDPDTDLDIPKPL